MKVASVLVAAVLLTAASVSQAALLTVTNPSFEDATALGSGPLADNAITSNVAYGWTALPGSNGGTNTWGIRNPQNVTYAGTTGSPGTMPSPADGVEFLYFQGDTIGQVLASTVTADTTYTLTVAVGSRLEATRTDVSDYVVQLVAGGTLGSGTVLTGTTTGSTATITKGTFQDQTFTYTVAADDPSIGLPLQIRIGRVTTVYTGSPTLSIDNVRLDAAASVPEPASLALMGLGSLALLRRRRA